MADRKSFLLRIDAGVLEAVQRWANDDLRSLNAQIEYLLRDALRKSGRITGRVGSSTPAGPGEPESGSSGGEADGTSTDPERLTDT